MNRHERRAAEARARRSRASGTDQNFDSYAAVCRRALKNVDRRDIGEGFMLGAAADASGTAGMIVYPPNEVPPPREQCGIELSATYGSQQFVAYAKAEYIEALKQEWPKFLAEVGKMDGHPLTGDMPSDTRRFIREMIVTNHQYDTGQNAALIGSAITWLATRSPVGHVVGTSHKHIHYEITDMEIVDGRKEHNYRLMLS